MDPCSAGTVRGGDGDFPGRPWRSDRACQGVRGVFEVGDQSAHSRTAACRDRVGRAGDDPAETEPAERLQADQRRDGRAQILEELQAVSAIVSSKATADEIPAFKQWLLTTAQAAADAAKEGGFMGFHATQVSQAENAMLDQVRTAIDA